MEVVVKKWGNSAAVRIPAAIMAAAQVTLDQSVDVHEENGRIIIEPMRRKTYQLEALIGNITDENVHASTDTDAPVGKEIW